MVAAPLKHRHIINLSAATVAYLRRGCVLAHVFRGRKFGRAHPGDLLIFRHERARLARAVLIRREYGLLSDVIFGAREHGVEFSEIEDMIGPCRDFRECFTSLHFIIINEPEFTAHGGPVHLPLELEPNGKACRSVD